MKSLIYYVLYILTISLTVIRQIGHFVVKNAGEHIPQPAKCPQGRNAMFPCLTKQILQTSASLTDIFFSFFCFLYKGDHELRMSKVISFLS